MTLVTFEHVILHGHMTQFSQPENNRANFSGNKKFNDAFQAGCLFFEKMWKSLKLNFVVVLVPETNDCNDFPLSLKSIDAFVTCKLIWSVFCFLL